LSDGILPKRIFYRSTVVIGCLLSCFNSLDIRVVLLVKLTSVKVGTHVFHTNSVVSFHLRCTLGGGVVEHAWSI